MQCELLFPPPAPREPSVGAAWGCGFWFKLSFALYLATTRESGRQAGLPPSGQEGSGRFFLHFLKFLLSAVREVMGTFHTVMA